MFDKVLVALDGSDHAANALRYAAELSKRCDATLVLFHAVEVNAFRSDYDIRVIESARDLYRKIGLEQAEGILQEAEEAAAAAGVDNIERVIGEGDPVKALLATLRTSPVDLIVVGTRGLTGLREIAMGSVAHKISVAATCPVLIVK
ncbi:MAG: universal stress protein [Gammaproteobacteria bacterium]|nr:universal stress protein [Gammaproteobacteria bacterium]